VYLCKLKYVWNCLNNLRGCCIIKKKGLQSPDSKLKFAKLWEHTRIALLSKALVEYAESSYGRYMEIALALTTKNRSGNTILTYRSVLNIHHIGFVWRKIEQIISLLGRGAIARVRIGCG